jgi:hypothetical protein
LSFVKDPEAEVDYQIDWSSYLSGATITSSLWTAPGLSITSDSYTSTTATVWLSGGQINERYIARNKITTSAGQTDVRGITITVAQRNETKSR